jgi:hypothetical protein
VTSIVFPFSGGGGVRLAFERLDTASSEPTDDRSFQST